MVLLQIERLLISQDYKLTLHSLTGKSIAIILMELALDLMVLVVLQMVLTKPVLGAGTGLLINKTN
jgi:hypothetical protein